MKNIAAVTLLCAIVANLAGCATTAGTSTLKSMSQEQAAHLLVVGKTTKAEVRAALGQADVTPFAGGAEFWVYPYEEGAARFASFIPVLGSFADHGRNIRELKIIMGADGIVKKYRLHDIELKLGDGAH